MEHISLTTTIFDFHLENCLSNASGVYCRLEEELIQLDDSSCGIIVSKSCSLERRDGNEEPRYFEESFGTINSMGLPNEGYKYYMNLIGKMKTPYMISVAGNYLMGNCNILQDISESMKNLYPNQTIMVEINVSCPNIAGKEQLAYNFEDLQLFLDKLRDTLEINPSLSNLILGLKLPPYFDPIHFQKLYDVLIQYVNNIQFLTAINSIGNALIVDTNTETVVLKPKRGLGGLGGKYIKPIALSNVMQLYQLFGDKMKIIACGGIETGEDVFQHILCGATYCQIGSQLMIEGPSCFQRIQEELKQIMQKKNYTNLNNFRGKINFL